MIMSAQQEVSYARSVPSEDTKIVLTTTTENGVSLAPQAGEDKQYAQSKYAKQKRWKDKNVDRKDKQAKENLLKKVRKDALKDRKKMGPQAGPIRRAISIDEESSSHSPPPFFDTGEGLPYPISEEPTNIFRNEMHRMSDDRLMKFYSDPLHDLRLLFKQMGVKEDAKILGIFENVVVLYIKLSRDKTWFDISTTLFLYAKTHTQKSAIQIVYDCLKGVFYNDDELEPQAGTPAPSWLKALREAGMNWNLIKNNPGFGKILKLVSICVSLGLCELTFCGFSAERMQQFARGARKVQYNSLDLVDAAMSTFVYFMECGYLCFTTRSIKPLFYGDMDVQRFNALYQECMLNIEYHKCGNLLSFANKHDVDFSKDLEECMTLAENLSRLSVSSYEKTAFLRYRDKITGWKAEFEQSRMRGGLRIAPYTIGVFGRTAVGKSSLANILMVYVLKINGFDAKAERLVTINEDDKYDSNMTSSVTGVFIDDLGNTKAQFVTEAPTAKLIRYCNNVKNYAVMASVEQKGKVAIEPKCVLITKNIKDSCATVYSNEPTSITRREHITITVKVRDKFATNGMLDPELVQKHGLHTEPVPDLWDLTVEKTVLVKPAVVGAPPGIGWQVVDNMQDVSIYVLLKWLRKNTEKYFASQEALVKVSGNLSEKMVLCPHCKLITRCCRCKQHRAAGKIARWFIRCLSRKPLNSQAGLHTLVDGYSMYATYRRTARWMMSFCSEAIPLARFLTRGIDAMLGTEIHERLIRIESSMTMRVLAFIPGRLVGVDRLANILLVDHVMKSRLVLYIMYLLCAIVSGWIVYLSYFNTWTLATIIIPVTVASVLISVERMKLYKRLVDEREMVSMVIHEFSSSHVFNIGCACVGIVAMYHMIRIAMEMRNKQKKFAAWKDHFAFDEQANIDPQNQDDIDVRDMEQNVWAVPQVVKRPATERMKTTTHDQLLDKVFKNLVYIKVTTSSEKTFSTNGFFIKSNVLLIPHHVMLEEEAHISITRNGSIGGRSRSILSRTYTCKVEGHDLVVAWIPNSGDWSDLSDYLPLHEPINCPGTLIYKTEEGKSRVSDVYCNAGEQRSTSHVPFKGARYHLSFPTFRGLCMSAVVADTKHASIYGFHVAGKDGTTLGCCTSPTRSAVDNAIAELARTPGVLLAMSSGTMEDTVLGVQFFESEKIHPKSPLNFLPEDVDGTFNAYGSVIGRAKYFSEVVETPISPLVEKHCKVPQMWGKPQFGVGYPWQKALYKRVTPAIGVEGSYLKWAVEDYAIHLIQCIERTGNLSKEIVPLTREETINGILGKRFIDKMPGSTSIGFPLTGPKSNYYFDVPVPDTPERQECVDLPPIFWDEVERIERIYLNKEERSYPILKACLKDEPTPLVKEKVRDFLALPVAFQLIVRKYFLPIARVMSMLPLHSECAVGINAHGLEWQQLHEYITKYGEDKILAGDYKAYDLKMPAQLTQAAFSIFLNIAAAFGYSKEELCIMRGVATDLSYPTVAYNGDLIGFTNTNPSGHNLTVYINCVVNSLLLRCAFCSVYGVHKTIKFQDVCALMTYGDDCIGSVNPLYPQYNHCTVAEYMKSKGMEFTMPDKESDPIPYLHMKECDFLKRKSVYHDAIKCNLGALEEMSIFKSLHSVLRSSAVSTKEQSVMNIDGAVREWFAHGKGLYEVRRAQMQQVAEEYGVSHACKELHYTYEDRIERWKDQYDRTDGKSA